MCKLFIINLLYLSSQRCVVTYNPKPGGWLSFVLSTRLSVPLIAQRDLNVALRVIENLRAQMQRCVYPTVCFASKCGVKRQKSIFILFASEFGSAV
ncbi:hypothetical protein MACK_003549 [Theileria orientalis]|uniref:Secreted protein n=1 Tax=Theileria orientalis TaxID=68886 RepID=A0A976SJC6_THEOR|nr:hypothetical protein MACK_003549 [Theileria orientalis]